MKLILHFILSAALLNSTAVAADKHDLKVIIGPKGGKILEMKPLHVEFFVQPDRKVSVTFYDAAMQPLAPARQEIKVIAEAKTGKATLDFHKTSEAFISQTTLPEGQGYRIVVQIKNDPSAKPQNFRLDYNSETCSGCQRSEYACSCTTHN